MKKQQIFLGTNGFPMAWILWNSPACVPKWSKDYEIKKNRSLCTATLSSSSLIAPVGPHAVWPTQFLSCATALANSQLYHPALFRSFSTVLPQVVFGLPLALRPSGVHPNALSQSFSPSLLSMWLGQFHLLRRTSQLMSLISANSTTLLFVILCCHLIRISKIQLVVYYQCCVLIGWVTTRLYVIAHY